MGLVLEVFESFGGVGRGDGESLGLVVGFSRNDQGPDDAGQFVGPGDDAFGPCVP
jgi:hypothetical protein